MEPLIHHNSCLAGKTVRWWPSDTEELYLRNLKDPAQYQQLDKFGWINADIEYSNNTHGFRTDEFETVNNFVTVGCSHTYGTGVYRHQSWPERLSQRLGLKVYNLAIPGGSGDTCYRILKHYVPLLRPKFVVMLEPESSRLEIFINARPLIHLVNNPDNYGFMSSAWLQHWYSDSNNMQVHSQKNIDAITHVCNSNLTNFFCYRDNFFLEFYSRVGGLARDLQHPGVEFHQAFADQVYQDIVNKHNHE